MHDLRISVTDRCNFRCTYCMPKEVFGRDYAFLPRDQVLTFEEIERLARVSSAWASRSCGSPVASRSSGATCRLDRDARRDPDAGRRAARPHADDQRLGASRAGAAARRRRARPGTVSLDSLDDATFGAMNGVDFPVAGCSTGSTRRARPGSSRSRSTWSSGAGSTSRASCRWRAGHARRGHDPAVHRVHGRRPHERLAAGRGRSGRGGRRARSARSCRSSRPTPATAARSPTAGAIATARRGRRHRVGDPAVLRRLHAGAAVGRGQALHVPVRGRRATTCGRCCAAGATDADAGDVDRRHLDASATTATPSSGRGDASCPGSRCSRWAAEVAARRSRTRLVHACPQRCDSWTARRTTGANFVDNRVDPPPARPVT